MIEFTILGSTTILGPVAILFLGIVFLVLFLLFAGEFFGGTLKSSAKKYGKEVFQGWSENTDILTEEIKIFKDQWKEKKQEFKETVDQDGHYVIDEQIDFIVPKKKSVKFSEL